MICALSPCAASAHSMTALNCGYPIPVLIRVVHTEPGPTPTLTISTPDRINSAVISPVTTLPAIIVALGNRSLSRLTASTKLTVYPFATSKPTNAISGKVLDTPTISSISTSEIPDITQSLFLRSASFQGLPLVLCCLAMHVTMSY